MLNAVTTLSTVGAYAALFALLICASISDIRNRIVSNKLVLAIVLIWVLCRGAVIAGTGEAIGNSGDMAPLIYSYLATAIIDTLASFAVALVTVLILFTSVMFYERIRGKFALGGADIKLIAAIALFVPLDMLLAVVFIACVISLIYALADMYAKPPRGIPFVPCLTCALPLALLVL